MVAFGLAPLLAQFAHALDDRQRELFALRVPAVVADPVLAVEDGGGLGQADVAERHGGALVLEQRVDVAARAEATEGAEAEQGGRVDRGGLLAAHDAELQRLVGDLHALVEQLPETFLAAVGFDGDARHVHGNDAEVHAAILLVLAGLGVDPALQEGAAAHRRLEGAGDLDDVLVEHDVRVHALGGAFQGELLQVVVRVAGVGVHAVAHGEHELREDCGVVVLAEAADAVEQDRALHLAGEPVGAQAEADGDERGLAVGDAVGVDLVLHRLHGVVDGLARADLGEDLTLLLQLVDVGVERRVHGQRLAGAEVQLGGLVGLGVLDLTTGELHRHAVGDGLAGLFEELLVVLLRVGGEVLVGTVGGLAAVLAGGHVLHDLGDLRGGDGDGLRGGHRRVAEREAVGEHVPEVGQRAVGLRGERRVVGVVEVDVALHVRVRDGRGQHVERGGLGDGAGEQVALSGVDVGILVRVLVDQRRILVDEAGDGLVDVRGLGALDVLVETVVGVGAGHVVQVGVDQGVLDEVLDVLDLGGTVVALRDLAFDLVGEAADQLLLLRADLLVKVGEGGLHGADDVYRVEVDDATVTLLHQHLGGGGGTGVHQQSIHVLIPVLS